MKSESHNLFFRPSVSIDATPKIPRLLLASEVEQPGLSLTWPLRLSHGLALLTCCFMFYGFFLKLIAIIIAKIYSKYYEIISVVDIPSIAFLFSHLKFIQMCYILNSEICLYFMIFYCNNAFIVS